MSYTWDNLETLSIEEVIQIFLHHSPAAKNILIAQIVGSKPIHYLPEEITTHIIHFLPIHDQITFGRTCKKYYSSILKIVKEYCIVDLHPLAWYDDDFRWELISQLSDDILTESIKNMTYRRKNRWYEVLLYIYQHTYEREFWHNMDISVLFMIPIDQQKL